MTLDGRALHDLARELYPLCRSITGDGVRATLARIGQLLPLTVHEVPTGTAVLDWTVPEEWNIREAWIATTDGRRVVDFAACNLHVVGYSRPVRARMSRQDLDAHLHSLPDRPDWIPYRTAYYAGTWGFCLSQRQRESLTDAEYDVCIDSTHAPGSLTYGECLVRGDLEDEVLLSAHVCHPSLANDNLSGIVTLAAIVQELAARPCKYTYRAIFAPGTIGAITWLALHEAGLHRLRHGLVLTCLGDTGPFTYKRSRREHAAIDRTVERVLRRSGHPFGVRAFSPDGYDERQYCSPGFDLPVGRLSRTPNGEFPEYHTSADDLALIRPDALAASRDVLLAIVEAIELGEFYVNRSPRGEPQLGRHGLYRSIGGVTDAPELEQAIRWVLNLSDGRHALEDIADRSGMPLAVLRRAADLLVQHQLLARADSVASPPGASRSLRL
jgi:aminopeptidase-like protein